MSPLETFNEVQLGINQETAQSEKRFPLQKPRWPLSSLNLTKI